MPRRGPRKRKSPAKKKRTGISKKYYAWREKNWKGSSPGSKRRRHGGQHRRKKIRPGLTGQVKRG